MKTWMAIAAGACLLAAGCAAPMDRASDVRTLRVLAVRAEPAFARPATTVPLVMLMHDGAPSAPRPVSVVWMAGCVNPPGDLYFNCYPALRDTLTAWPAGELARGIAPSTLQEVAGSGTSFALRIPSDAITGRAQPEGYVHAHGVLYAFFAACAGELRALPPGGDGSLPLGCFEPGSERQLGQDDFEFGYHAVYVYDDVENRNPGLHAVQFQGSGEPRDCAVPGDCATGQHCGSSKQCIPAVPHCAAEPEDCPAYRVSALVDRDSLEQAVTANLTDAEARPEAFWVSYYATAGRWDKDTRMVHDPYAGWAEDADGQWRAAAAGGVEVRLWAVLRDSRAGVSWAWRDVWVE
jgi:hypothetical protein